MGIFSIKPGKNHATWTWAEVTVSAIHSALLSVIIISDMTFLQKSKLQNTVEKESVMAHENNKYGV